MRRLNFLFFTFLLFALLVIYRLFWWQVKAGEKLAILAESQRTSQIKLPAQRGRIFSADSFPLVENQEAYLVYADLTKISQGPSEIAVTLAPLLNFDVSTPSAEEKVGYLKNTELKIKQRLENPDLAWVALKHKVKKGVKEKREVVCTSKKLMRG